MKLLSRGSGFKQLLDSGSRQEFRILADPDLTLANIEHFVHGVFQDALSVYRHVREVHSKDSIQDGFVMHMETGRIFLNVSLYRHVLECGFFGCTAFVGRNSSLEDAQVGDSIVGCPTFLIIPLVFYRILVRVRLMSIPIPI